MHRIATNLALIVGCGNGTSTAAESFADLVLVNARIFTVDDRQPWAKAVAIRQGRILAVGSDAEILEYADDSTNVVNLEEHLVLPGFQDAHLHPLEGASAEEFFTCQLNALRGTDAETWIEPIAECVDHETSIAWVMGGGHYISDLIDLEPHPTTT